MTGDRRTEQLLELLGRVREILAEGRRSLVMNDADRWKALALTRWEMLRALNQLNRYKRLYVLDPIRFRGSEDLTRRARRLVESNLELVERYHHFVERWSLTNPLSVDEAYRIEALDMARLIERQMAVDAHELQFLLHSAATDTPGRGTRSPSTSAEFAGAAPIDRDDAG